MAKAKRSAPRKKKSATRTAKKPVLLSGDNPQIPKGLGDAHVQAYLKAIPGWKKPLGRRLDELVTRTIPGVQKAVKWNTPFYGISSQGNDVQGWFLAFHCFTNYIKVTFFRGTSLNPVPPGESRHPEVRYLDVHRDELDEAQLVDWVKQASQLPGEKL